MDGGAWWATVHGVGKSQTWLRNFTFTFHFHSLDEEMATHSSILAWRIPGTEEPCGLPSMGSHRVGHDWRDLAAAAAAALPVDSRVYCYCCSKSHQSCPTLCDPIDGSPPGSPVPGILQARRLEWVAISFSNAWKWKVKVKSLSCVRLCATPWTAAHQAPLPMGFLQARVLEWGAVAFSIVGYIERKFMTKVTVLSIHEMNVVYSQGK